jgi:hypothetical protein
MSDFGDRIKDARTSTRPLVGLAAVQAAEQPAPAEVPGPAVPEDTAGELEAHRRRVDELARRVDALNAALLRELTHHPHGPAEFPRTMAVLADELADRVSDSE